MELKPVLINPQNANQAWLDEWTDRYLLARAGPLTAEAAAIAPSFTGIVSRYGPFHSRGYAYSVSQAGDLMITPI